MTSLEGKKSCIRRDFYGIQVQVRRSRARRWTGANDSVRAMDARWNLTVRTDGYHCSMTTKEQIVEAIRTAIQAEQRTTEAFDPTEAVPADEMAAELRDIMAQRWPGK